MATRKDIRPGKRSYALVMIKRESEKRRGYALFKCDCGKTKSIRTCHVFHEGKCRPTKSCGCGIHKKENVENTKSFVTCTICNLKYPKNEIRNKKLNICYLCLDHSSC